MVSIATFEKNFAKLGLTPSLGGMSVCVIVRFLEVSVQGLWGYAPFLIQNPEKTTHGFLMLRFLNARY